MAEQPTFDFGGAPCTHAGERPASTWHEVPQALFLSWSDCMQAAYCRDRDLDSAEHESDREFYIERARYYDEVVRCSTT